MLALSHVTTVTQHQRERCVSDTSCSGLCLGLASDSQVVQVLEAESQTRLNQFNQKDLSMVFSSSMKLHPGSQHPLTEACLAGLEKNLERERHPQTLFLLLSYYRLKLHSLQPQEAGGGGSASSSSSTPSNPELLLANR